MAKHAFTFTRQLAADGNKKPDAFLFASDEPLQIDTILKLMRNPDVLSLMPVDTKGKRMPIMGYHYEKHGEHRLLITALSYYTLTLCDKNSNIIVYYEDAADKDSKLPKDHKEGEMKILKYQEALDGCMELYRTMGCDGCPKKGAECVTTNLHYRPWIFRFAYNRTHEFAAGLLDEGTVADRDAKIVSCELQGDSCDAVLKQFNKKKIEGFSYMTPAKTKADNSAKQSRPLRPPRDHRLVAAGATDGDVAGDKAEA